MSLFTENLQQAAADELIELFTLDLTALGDSVYRFTSNQLDGAAVQFDGETYTPIDVDADGFEYSGRGSLPEPKLRISNATLALAGAVITLNDLIGGRVTRTRTFKRFLDGQPDADPTAIFDNDIFFIDRKTAHNKVFIEWQLSAVIDQEGQYIPRRQCIRDICTHKYRVWDGSNFIYTNATCPYNGGGMYEADDSSTANPADDVCGKRLSSCKVRFNNTELPTRAFPGIARTRVK